MWLGHYGKINSLSGSFVLECSDWVLHVACYLPWSCILWALMWCTIVKQANCNVQCCSCSSGLCPFSAESYKTRQQTMLIWILYSDWCMWVDCVWIFNVIGLMNPHVIFKLETLLLFCDIINTIWQQIKAILFH